MRSHPSERLSSLGLGFQTCSKWLVYSDWVSYKQQTLVPRVAVGKSKIKTAADWMSDEGLLPDP